MPHAGILWATGFASIATAASLRAISPDAAIVAAMKLTDAQNYSWRTSVADDARSYTIEAQTDRATDFSLVTMPMVGTLRRHAGTGTSNSENVSTVVFYGDEKFVVQVGTSWNTPQELASGSDARDGDARNDQERRERPRGRASRGDGGLPGLPRSGDSGQQNSAYSNLQKTLSRPHEEIAIIVATATDLKMDGEILSGALSETAAKLLIVHAGQPEITPLKAGGSFRFWIQNGALTKYELELSGTLAVLSRGRRHEIDVHQTAVTEIKHVGSTKVEVPAAAQKKLGG